MLATTVPIWLLATAVTGQLTSDVDRLMKNLFIDSSYNRILRPVVHVSTVTKVSVAFSIYSIHYVDVTKANIKVNGVFSMAWKDEFLSWNETEYGGLDTLSPPPGFIWTPVIALSQGSINDVDIIEKAEFSPTWVTNTGHVYMFPAGEIISTCTVDVFLFPFDSHECKFTLVSARYGSKELVVTSHQAEIDLSTFLENSEWIASNSALKEMGEASGGRLNISYVSKLLKVTRRPAFVIIHIFVPVMLISFLNIATCYVPLDSGERLSFTITLFMSFVFLSGTIVNELPRNSIAIPVSSYIVGSLNLLNALLVLWSIVILRVSRWSPDEHKIPMYVVQLLTRTDDVMSCKQCNVLISSNENDSDENSSTTQTVDYQDATCDTHKASWYKCALLLDKIQFVVLVTLTAILFIIEIVILKVHSVI